MGAGKSRHYAKTIGGISLEGNYENNLTDEEFKALHDFLWKDLDNYRDDKFDDDILKQLSDLGIKVEMRSGFDELKDQLKSLGLDDVSVDDIIKLGEHKNGINGALSDHFILGNKSEVPEKVFTKLGDLRMSQINNLDSAISKLGSSHIKWANENKTESSYCLTNSSLGTLLALSNISKELKIKQLDSVAYDPKLRNVGVSGIEPLGFYDTHNNTIRVGSKGLLKYYKTTKDVTNFNVSGIFPQSIITHEFGHHIHNIVFKDKNVVKGKSAVSTYGNSNHMEAFAESFSAYCLGITPTQGKEYHSNFKKLMKESGLSKFEGCIKKPRQSTTKTNTSVTKTSTSKVTNFNSSSNSISGAIKGKSFSATLTDGIKKRGYIERTVGNTKYRIDIITGSFTKV